MKTHQCPAPGCTKQVPHNKLMCHPHWCQVPARLKFMVHGAYYKEGPGTEAHLAACHTAIAAVADRLSQPHTIHP